MKAVLLLALFAVVAVAFTSADESYAIAQAAELSSNDAIDIQKRAADDEEEEEESKSLLQKIIARHQKRIKTLTNRLGKSTTLGSDLIKEQIKLLKALIENVRKTIRKRFGGGDDDKEE